jgi:soluble lytic murein transglycosylase-like protein
MRIPSLIAALSLTLMSAAARADIYGYVDAQGDPHFSTEKADERYQLFMRGDQSFDSTQLTPGPQAGGKTRLMQYLAGHPNLLKYDMLLKQAATDFSIDPALLKAVMAAESGFNPAAVSPKGAVGLMQVMPATAQRYGLQADGRKSIEQKLADPKTNIRLAARYLRDLFKLFPDRLELVLASYNAGEGAVQKYRDKVPPYPETRNYVQLVTQFYRMYQPPGARYAATASGAGSSARRIHMTIPGRGNLPAAAPMTITE